MEPPLEMEAMVGAESVGVSVSEGAACSGPEDLVARAIAPVKAQYLRAPPSRSGSLGSEVVDNAKEKSRAPKVVVTKEKKSRRQLKRERKQVVLSVAAFGIRFAWSSDYTDRMVLRPRSGV